MATRKKALKKMPATDPKLERWKKRGESLAKAKDKNQWSIGGWILEGEETFGKKRAVTAAEEATGMKRATLYMFRDTAASFPISTRVKNLFFGHHRLVAKKKRKSKDGVESGFTREEQKRLLRTAATHEWPVAKFADYLKSREKKIEQQEDTPTTADAAAQKVVELCQHLRDNKNLRALFKSDPPKDYEWRKQVVEVLRATADELNKNAEWLKTNWDQFDLVHYHDLRAAAAGSGR